ncbi:centrosomal protein of 295 kDa isoform X2 [Platichthys flesus]|uniref:centrosomal protein of 295 kDa isoform X2 n=1 Tax=Platichthys flesus TaxID=8260 RepID=UPI002DB7F532|nr:centrosomal protein of 295 kDa isoform X2 [Platichthys flesus]
MKRKLVKLRPSPNEEARILREEHERRRKLRIQQVREQQRHIAQQIRLAVEQRRQQELELLGERLRLDWEQQQQEKLHTLQRLYQESLQQLGQGHRSAKENEPDLAAIAQREEENHAKADQRYREALKELKSQRLKEHERQSQLISSRKKALQTEKERSAKLARLPPPPPNPVQNIDYKKPHVVKKSDVSAFATTHYNMPESTVDREEDTQQMNAHEAAELEAMRRQELQRDELRRRGEQLEKARARGRQALRREQLVQDRERLLVELEHMQQTDLLRRRQQVSQMPPQIFQPLYKRQETRDDFQREIEFAFEDMYTGERRDKGDLVLQLAPEPIPALSTGSKDQELDVTLDEITTPGTEHSPHEAEQEAESNEQETSAQGFSVEPSKPAPRRALKKLLDRIRGQRNQSTEHSRRVSPADSLTVMTDQIPERDTTIETGSLTSGEKDQPAPIELLQPVLSPPEKTSTIGSSVETSPAANTRQPDELANRIQDFGEERKKREEQLEREKQQQLVLLQELEKQKVKLEQMLLEAQHEREHLKAAAGKQEVDFNRSDGTDQDQEVVSVLTGPATELEPPAGEDDHHRRIREYQQRLLEQNRTHQRSVEVARQRLEEYQRALRIRYSMTSPLLQSAVVPPGHPPLHLPTPPPLTTTPGVPSFIHNKPLTSIEVPTRESDILVSPPLTGSSLSAGFKLLPGEVESRSNCSRNQRADVSSWLTDNIMERVTEHLPQRVRPSSLKTEPPPHKLFTSHPSTNIPLQRSSDPIQATSSSIWDDAPRVPGHAEVQPGVVFHGSLQTMSSRRDDKERQRRELQEFQRRVQEQKEAIELQKEEERLRGELQKVHKQEVELQEFQRRKVELQEFQRREVELQEFQRRVQEQKEAIELQQEERRRGELQEFQRREVELQEFQRREVELQEFQRRVQEQKEAIELQQEERRRGELQEVHKREVELQEFQRRMQERREVVDLQQEERRRVELQEVQRNMQEQRREVELQEQRREVELQEFQRRVQQQREAVELQQEEGRQRGELQEVQRNMQEQRREVELQEQRREVELQEFQRRVQQQREAVELQQEEGRQRGELQEVQRRMQEQREVVELQQEDEKRRREDEMEQMRQQKETLKALIHTDAQPVPDVSSEELVSENTGQTRLRLLAFLLKAIEESNGGTLSHLQDPDTREATLHLPLGGSDPIAQTSVPAPVLLPELLPPPVRAAKPPVTRIRLGIMEATEQHELSAIQEVETSVMNDKVTGPEKNLKVPSAVKWDLEEESDLSISSDRTLDTPSVSSSGKRTVDSSSSSGTNSETSHHHIWRERLLTGAVTSPESSEPDSVLRRISPPSSDSGRGADVSGPAATSYRSFTESPLRPPDPDCFSSTTISSGSYITTDPEQNVNTDTSPAVTLCEEQGADVLDVSSPTAQLSFIKDTSAARRHGVAVQTLFNDGSIQRIIERYTRELDFSLSSAGRATDSEASYVDEPGSVGGASEGEGAAGRQTPPPGPRTQSDLDRDFRVNPILDPFSGDTSLQAEDSFRPLIGQLAEQSSCLAADQRDSAMERLVGQPSAHSSMIGQLQVSVGQGAWDSSLSRMIGRLSHRSSVNGRSGWQDASQLMGPMVEEPSTTWLDEVQEESQMRPLVGEPDTDQHSGVSGEWTNMDPSVPAEASLPSHPASTHCASAPAASPHPQDQIPQNQTSPMDLDPERTDGEKTVTSSDQRPYVFPGSDSFHPLLAELTHNDTADPSMTFHLLSHKVLSSPELSSEESSASSPPGGSDTHSDSSPPGGSDTHSDSSVESEPSPERLRSEDPASHQLLQDQTQESALVLEDTMSADVELSLSKLTMCDEAPAAGTSQPAGGAADRFQDSVQVRDVCEEMTSEPGSDLRRDTPLFRRIMEAACEKGILEQSEITLVSLTDEDTTITEEEGVCEENNPDEEGQKSKETKEAESTSSEDGARTHPVPVLDVHWGLSRRLQDVNEQKRKALIQRSSRRVEGIKAKVALNKNRAESEAREEETELQTESQAGESKTSGFIQKNKCQPPPPASASMLKEVKLYGPEQRKRDVCEMYQRTQRLFHQLEEVKQQKTIRSRREASAQNRLKAKEFHKKTLEKLRAKQTQQ